METQEEQGQRPSTERKACIYCGKPIFARDKKIEEQRKYCSFECFNEARSGRQEAPFPAVFRFETKRDYAKRCMNMEKVAKAYPNRKERFKVLQEFHKTVPYRERNAFMPPGKHLFFPDACRFLEVSQPTLNKWEKKGIIKPGVIRYKGKRYRIYEVAVLEQVKKVYYETLNKKPESDSD